MDVRETTALIALLAQRALPWDRLAGEVEEEGSAVALLDRLQHEAEPRLFDAAPGAPHDARVWLEQWISEGIRVITSSTTTTR